ncbi:hypothetical protein [Ochrobactrum sp. EDr1-4]|uniref:hypothetical protein n=1 Tax=Ochrobactrum sp. EDr1-4 TaxID=3368622 RepID=UPI003BA017B1
MARGGKRDGAGRPAGTANKRTRDIADNAIKNGISPLEYMLSILRDEKANTEDRFEAAKAAAPYVHPKLSSVEHKGDEDNPLQTVTRIELVAPDDDSED